ncbi:CRISPR-associated protein [Alteribacter lacisalsi]|uniref:CRISPR-associated protein n=2 Tax=Alteribacter lacisalsi TaxID=2045244 RepID=A0A2W0HJM6_9BACI|nr:CRISPR-associated protein [Alteribacter lacisalsi]
MANWNAGFHGAPKQTSDGRIYGSDKAAGYAIKHYWEKSGEKVLYYKRYTEKKKDELSPMSLKQSYERMFGENLSKKTPPKNVLRSLFGAVDVVNFGCTFATAELNTSITGAVQIGQGFNVDDEGQVEVQDILSPFPSDDEKGQSSIGKQVMLSEGHYVYPFSINPSAYEVYEELLDIENPYTVEVYEKFKKGALRGATHLNSSSKAGCYNEFGLFVELKEGSEMYLEPIDNMVVFSRLGDKVEYDFTKISERLKEVEGEIEDIVLYYNPYKIEVRGTENFTEKNIFTDL